MKTLIVEDVQFLGMILERIVEPYSMVEFAKDGSEAIDMFSKAVVKNEPYDLIFLDLLMPKIDGFEVLFHVRKFEDDFNLDADKKSKIIVVSTFSDAENVTKARKAGCDGYIIKPYRKDKVLEELRSLKLIPAEED